MNAKQTWIQSHAETLTQNIVGLLIGFIILKCFGLTASESVQLSEKWFHGNSILISDLKRLVESVDLVKEHKGLDRAIDYANSTYTAPEIKVCLLDAIADYKSIYINNDMGDDSHIENKNCKVIDYE